MVYPAVFLLDTLATLPREYWGSVMGVREKEHTLLYLHLVELV